MPDHFLLSTAKRSPRVEQWRPPSDAKYDESRGLWMQHGAPLILADARKPGTKKRDFEPGSEDLKYE